MSDLALLMIFPALMAFAAASDLVTMTIPNTLSLALVAAFAGFAYAAGLPSGAVLMHIGAAATVLIVCFGMFAFGWIGGGDAKLAAGITLWFGFGTLIDYLALASCAGGLLTLALIWLRRWPLPAFALGWSWVQRLHDRTAGIPYGIALAGAALAVYPESPVWVALTTG
jgi:prepilin peptidase CpaA